MKQRTKTILTIELILAAVLLVGLLAPHPSVSKFIPSINAAKPKSLPTTLGVSSSNTSSPAQVLDLTNWKITLPFGSDSKSKHPLEILQPELATYKIDPWFIVTPDGKGIVFRAAVNGLTTSGTKYPRSELREMTDSGKTPASWSSTQGTHTMFLDEAITHVPQAKPQVVAGQIHDNTHDIIVIRLEQPNLYVNVDGKNLYKLDNNYTLGKRFTVKFVVSGGKTDIYYNGSEKSSYTLNLDYNNSYFKAGAYTQSNCKKEGKALCNANNYGEVVIYGLQVTHQ